MASIEARTLTIDGSNPARDESNSGIDVHKSVHRKIIMKTTNEMQLCRLIYYF
jgi:hypothetical protein